MIYAFVDVETTGYSARDDRIIEIAIVRYENGVVIDTFQTLINPEVYVGSFIQEMTGIDPHLLEDAPTFAQTADEVLERFEDAVLVAHNVGFDFGFLSKEFARLNYVFRPSRLCTVQLSRVLYPQFRSHGLDSIISRFGIACADRHRALDDTLATVRFFEIAQQEAGQEYFEQTLKRLIRLTQLPSYIAPEIIEKLPSTSGVYYFYGENGTLLYVGKSINIRQRVKDHFYVDDPNALKFLQEIRDIDYEITAGEIGALIRESQAIKERMPVFNKQLRRTRRLVLAKEVLQENGYKTISLEEKSGINAEEVERIVGVYRSKKQAKEHVALLTAQHHLCDRFMGLENTRGACFGYHLKRCRGACFGHEVPAEYNARFDIAFGEYRLKSWPYDGPVAIREYNPEYEMSEAHVLDKWCYLGSAAGEEDLTDVHSKDRTFEYDTYKILSGYIHKNRAHVVPLGSQGV